MLCEESNLINGTRVKKQTNKLQQYNVGTQEGSWILLNQCPAKRSVLTWKVFGKDAAEEAGHGWFCRPNEVFTDAEPNTLPDKENTFRFSWTTSISINVIN